MAPPHDDEFYMRGIKIAHYKMAEMAMKKRGVPADQVSLWCAQREARRAVITREMLQEAQRILDTECW